jgi:copper chaperone NosL
MTIVENKFGAEIISTKGKVYKFDAVECMINFVNKGKMNQSDVESYWAVDYNSPGTLINASSAYYLISQNIPSPMGANLSTYTSKTNAETKKNVSGGEVFNWSELQNRIGR